MDDYENLRWRERFVRILHTLCCSAAIAVIVATVLLLMTALSGCVATQGAALCNARQSQNLSECISFVAREMQRSGCWVKDVSVSYSSPTSYVISATGPYYSKQDKNKEVRE